jgi:hypothetical protein
MDTMDMDKLMDKLKCMFSFFVKKYLDMSINSTCGIRKQDSATVITSVAKNPFGRNLVR